MKTSERNVYFDIEFHNLAHWKENVAHPCTILLKIVRHAQLTKFKNWHTALKRLPTPDIAVINTTVGIPDIVNVRILINNVAANALIDTDSMLSYVNQKFELSNESNEIGFTVTGNCFQSKEVCLSTICLQNRTYYDVKLHVLKDLLTDVIVGQDILRLHDHIRFNFGGLRPSCVLCIIFVHYRHLFVHYYSNYIHCEKTTAALLIFSVNAFNLSWSLQFLISQVLQCAFFHLHYVIDTCCVVSFAL